MQGIVLIFVRNVKGKVREPANNVHRLFSVHIKKHDKTKKMIKKQRYYTENSVHHWRDCCRKLANFWRNYIVSLVGTLYK